MARAAPTVPAASRAAETIGPPSGHPMAEHAFDEIDHDALMARGFRAGAGGGAWDCHDAEASCA